MIVLCTEENFDDFKKACLKDSIYGAMNYSRHTCYSHLPHLALFWIVFDGSEPVGTVSNVMGDGIVSCIKQDCTEEISHLVCTVGISSLLGDSCIVKNINSVFGGSVYSAPTMVCNSGCLSPDVHKYTGRWRTLYDFICKGYPYFAAHSNYDDWLSSLTMRVNRGTASVYTIQNGDEILACGIIGFKGEKSGEIGSIVTAPEARGKGYGKKITRHLAAVLESENRTAFLHLAENSLVPFYESAGFSVCGEWGSISTQ
ncbi:MAG: GNAT family N-acetyltransferase [Oscillospiraceae bacterium]|nr:GNAT family N-acetyltransferase [Oscillospiraceae bacterium]